MTSQLLHAFDVLDHHLRSIGWEALAAAVALHSAKIVARTRAWRNILAAAYPAAKVRWRSVFGSYVSGAAVNALLPARSGDVLKLYLIKHRIEGSAYPTLVATLAVETLFDLVASTALLIWALHLGVLPGLDVLPRLRTIDWSWVYRNPHLALVVGVSSSCPRPPRRSGFGDDCARRLSTSSRRRDPAPARTLPPRRRQLAASGLGATARHELLAPSFIRTAGERAQRTARAGGAEPLDRVPADPAGIGTEQGLIAYVFSGRAPVASVLSFSVGMKIALMTVNLVIGFSAIALMLGTFRWRKAIATDRR